MQVIILAAGTGSRLGVRTANVPKPCVVVGGRALLDYNVAFARAAGATRISVVTGSQAELSQALARTLNVDDILWNPRFADAGNLLSLGVARDAGRCEGAFLLMNSDHIYRPAIAKLVARTVAEATHVTGFIDHDRSLGPDDMKAQLDRERRITAIAKTLTSFDAGYVGMTFVPAAARAAHLELSLQVLAQKGDASHVEAVLARFAETGAPAHTCDISGHGWLEVDDETDWNKAEAALAAARARDEAWYL